MKKLLVLAAALLVAYAAAEAACRVLLATVHKTDLMAYAEKFSAKAAEKHLSLEAYGRSLALNPRLGWDSDPRTHGTGPDEVLFFGDSVTYGFDAEVNVNDFVTLLGLAGPARTVNFAASGFGLDQMLLQLTEKLPGHRPKGIFVCYIPHDIRRMGVDCFVGLTKPRLAPDGQGVRVEPPRPIGDFYADLERARSQGRLAAWYVANKLGNLMYSNPDLYAGRYERLLTFVAEELRNVARTVGCPVTVVALPNFADPVSSRVLAPIAARVFARESRPGELEFLDLEPCLRRAAEAGKVDFGEFSREHPGPAGHAAIAGCLEGRVEGR